MTLKKQKKCTHKQHKKGVDKHHVVAEANFDNF